MAMRQIQARRWLVGISGLLFLLIISLVVLVPRLRVRPEAPIRTWTAGSSIAALAFSPDGQSLAAGGGDGSTHLWRVADGTSLLTLHNSAAVSALAYNPDGQLLAVGDTTGMVRLWTAVTGAPGPTLAGQGTVRALAFSPDGQHLASEGEEPAISLWRVADGQSTAILPLPTMWTLALDFSSDGQTLTVGTSTGALQVWDVVSARMFRTQTGATAPRSGSARTTAVVPAPGGSLASTVFGGIPEIFLWQRRDGVLLRVLTGHRTDIGSLAFSPDGRHLASGGGRSIVGSSDDVQDFSVRLWQASDGKQLAQLTGHTASVRALVWQPSGQLLASGSDDGTVRLWTVAPNHAP
jgi:WD40 repeat protein